MAEKELSLLKLFVVKIYLIIVTLKLEEQMEKTHNFVNDVHLLLSENCWAVGTDSMQAYLIRH